METDTYSEFLESNAREEEVTPTVIQAGGTAPSFGGAPSDDAVDAYPRRFANPALNSRVAATPPASNGPWEVQWQVDLEFPCQFVLVGGKRVVVQGESWWHLITLDGESVRTGKLRHSEVVLSGEHDQFYFQDRGGYLTARHLTSGEFAFSMVVELGNRFRRPYIVRQDQRMVMVGIERRLNPHALPPKEAHAEVIALGDPLRVNQEGMLTSRATVALRSQQSTRLLAALQGDTLTLATDNHVFRADLDLTIRIILTDEFVPLVLSLDGDGHMYLVVRGEDRDALWGVTPDGNRFLDVDLDARVEEIGIPPIIGYDSLLYLVVGDRVLAFQTDGRRVWEDRMSEPVGGAVVTAGGQLHVAAGPVVIALDETGERELLFYAEGESLTTPPVLSDGGQLFVASTDRLYCLQPRK